MVGTMESNSSSIPVPESQAQEPMDTDTETDVEQQEEKVGASISTIPETHSYFVCSNLSHGQPALVSCYSLVCCIIVLYCSTG